MSEAATAVAPYLVPDSEKTNATRAAERLADLPILGGNRVELLIDGAVTFRSILDGIDAAEEYVLFQFFIVHDDELGREVQSRLIKKARQGVRVYFLYDEVGSNKLPQQLRRMSCATAGVEMYDFHSRKGTLEPVPDQLPQPPQDRRRRRSHTTWIGGHNVGDEYLGQGSEVRTLA